MNGDSFELYTSPAQIPTASKKRGPMRMFKANKTTGNNIDTLSGTDTRNFPDNLIEFKWGVQADERFDPSGAYMRIRCQLSADATTPLKLIDEIAPNMGLCANLFANYRVELKDSVQVSKLDNYSAQIDALVTRQTNSKSWMDSVGTTTNLWQSRFSERLNVISGDGQEDYYEQFTHLALGFTDLNTLAIEAATGICTIEDGAGAVEMPVGAMHAGDEIEVNIAGTRRRFLISVMTTDAVDSKTFVLNELVHIALVAAVTSTNRFTIFKKRSRRVAKFELIWFPPLGFFRQTKYLPMHKGKFILNPASKDTYQKRAIESLVAKTAGTDYKFGVLGYDFYYPKMKASRIQNLTYYMDLTEVHCQTGAIAAQQSAEDKDFSVKKSTYALTAALQDSRAGSNELYSASKFKVGGIAGNERFVDKLRIDYAGMSKSIPDANPQFVVGTTAILGIDYRAQRYVDSLYYSDAQDDQGGSETIEDWTERGPYYHFDWIKDGSNNETEVNVNIKTSTSFSNARILLFSHTRNLVKVVIKNQMVESVEMVQV